MNEAGGSGNVIHIYWHGGPVSLDLIEPNLYLGNLTAAIDVNIHTKYGITHILTIDTCPLPRNILEIKTLTFKYIHLSDQPKEDLLSHFDDTYNYISNALTNNGTVFVHCYFGVSRSASVIIAFLLKKYQLSYPEAFEKAHSKRNLVCPNEGFVSQLKLYKEMGYTIDNNNMKYKIYRLGIAAGKVRQAKILPQDYFNLIKADPGLTQIHPEPNVYRCKKCRRVLASESNLIAHIDRSTNANCVKIYFIEPLSWMAGITQLTQGKLHCPKCNTKVGSFSWICGCQCHCGSKIAPAFYMCPSKVDWSNVVKNVECTI